MRLPALVVTDLHLTANPRDEYRWKLFPWLAHECRRNKVRTLLILGDLTDAKDYHSAELVNRVADDLDRLSEWVDSIVILMGNHDYLKSGKAFFAFLRHHPKIRFITEPLEEVVATKTEVNALYLPHSKDPAADWKNISFRKFDLIFMHQTVNGSVTSNGQAMSSSLGASFGLKGMQRIYSGDIHVPQVIGDVVYVGSPYPVHFGDTFKPRCVLIEEDGLAVDKHFYCLQRLTLDLTMETLEKWPNVYEGDQVKIRVHLGAADRPLWSQIRNGLLALAKELKVEVVSLEMKAAKEKGRRTLIGSSRVLSYHPADRVESLVRSQDLGGDLLDAGLSILEDER